MRQTRAFTLVEIVVVFAVIAFLTALLLPVLSTARGRARQTSCLSNLKQIGISVGMYMQDCDGRYPRAVDPLDRAFPRIWTRFPQFAPDVVQLPLLNEVLQPYTKSAQVFSCPADSGFSVTDFAGLDLDAKPTSFEKFGTSYYYRTEVAAQDKGESALKNASQLNLIFDGAGYWHGSLVPIAKRYNCLFADFHVKNISYETMNEAWQMPAY